MRAVPVVLSVSFILGAAGFRLVHGEVAEPSRVLRPRAVEARVLVGGDLDELRTLLHYVTPESLLPPLRKGLRHPISDTRRNALDAIGVIGPPAKAAIPEIIPLLDDSSVYVARAAAAALGEIGPQTEDVVPALAKALHAGAADTRFCAAQAIGKFGAAGSKAAPVLTAALADSQEYVRREAALTTLRDAPQQQTQSPP